MRDMEITSNSGAEQKGWKIIVPFPGEIVGKAVFEDDNHRIMKSTKRFPVYDEKTKESDNVSTQVFLGWIYNTSTEMHKGDEVSVAEALVFVPER